MVFLLLYLFFLFLFGIKRGSAKRKIARGCEKCAEDVNTERESSVQVTPFCQRSGRGLGTRESVRLETHERVNPALHLSSPFKGVVRN